MDTQKIKKDNRKMKCLAGVIACIYIAFFTSNQWFPASKDYVNATGYFVNQTYDSYEICVETWEYAKDQDKMKVVLQTKNTGIADAAFSYSAVERSLGEIETTVVVEEDEFTIIYLTDVPSKWTEISLRISTEDEKKEPLRLYANKDSVKKVNVIEDSTIIEYRAEHIHLQAENCQAQITEKEVEIEALTTDNAKYRKRMQKLEQDKEEKQLLEEEQQEITEMIEQAQVAIEQNLKTIEKIKEEIEALETKILYLEDTRQ